ncbi:MAG: tetratricopeptide repeat protein [Bacteroidota bacterium]
MIKKIFLILSIVFMGAYAMANENDDLIFQANAAYSEEKFSTALELYRKVLSNGWEAPELYYNLGNASFKTNDFPSAVYYYEKALKLDPSNENYDFNLKVANTKIIDKIEAVPLPFYTRWWYEIRGFCSSGGWAVWSIISFALFLALIAIYLIAQPVRIRKLAFWTAAFMLLAVIFINIFALEQYRHISDSSEAIVFDATVNVKSSPNELSQDIFVIHEGTKVKITDKVGEWCEVRIANGSLGWIKASSFKII